MVQNIPEGFSSQFVQLQSMRLHIIHNGQVANDRMIDDGRPVLLMLHGFPEFWIAWREVFIHLSKDFLVIAPDQRGYNLSDAPAGVENYQAKLLVQDVVELTEKLIGDKPFTLAGHDWGASVAYALAMKLPARINRLVIANGVHPVCFQEAMIDDPSQAKASSYFHVLRRENAGELMAENGFSRTLGMFERFSRTPWLTDEIRDEYRTAWSGADRLACMLHWYNSSPIIVPTEGQKLGEKPPLYGADRSKFRISMPHLLIWGNKDQALLSSATKALPDFCDDLQRVEIDDGDHWLLHTHGEQIASEIRKFAKDAN